eukprot:TRINITY_DN2791_c0_g1_i3.p1 TRINITY_DN2791_c0_g1~~TRINITY_DN2791_c0_g1_i3.p1  ORF type:complete len:176 (-),score=3.68 TRINITY_DN2791_c0_g1_i3:3-530(-)
MSSLFPPFSLQKTELPIQKLMPYRWEVSFPTNFRYVAHAIPMIASIYIIKKILPSTTSHFFSDSTRPETLSQRIDTLIYKHQTGIFSAKDQQEMEEIDNLIKEAHAIMLKNNGIIGLLSIFSSLIGWFYIRPYFLLSGLGTSICDRIYFALKETKLRFQFLCMLRFPNKYTTINF